MFVYMLAMRFKNNNLQMPFGIEFCCVDLLEYTHWAGVLASFISDLQFFFGSSKVWKMVLGSKLSHLTIIISTFRIV